MPHASITATLLLAFLLGLRHALDADHLAAVAAMASGQGGLRRCLGLGISWGVGHALVLGVVGGGVVALQVPIPPRIGLLFESLVALTLIALGVGALRGALSGRLHAHRHEHGGVVHAHVHLHVSPHPGPSRHGHPHPIRLAFRPFLVGGVHGLAGSATLAILVLTSLPNALLGCLFLGILGAGSILGMSLMSLALGVPLALAQSRARWLHCALRATTGVGSLGIGLTLIWEIGRARGLV